jgi:hypothetical protein
VFACSGRPNVFTESRDVRLQRYDQERARLQRATNPVDRTRIQIRISDLLISFMGDAVGDGDREVLEARLDEYRETIINAYDTMMNSGRDATRSPGGFRELEIALRQHIRQLGDIGSQLTFENREPIERLISEVSSRRDQLLDALFPGQTASNGR